MDDETPQVVLDEELLLLAAKTLAELEDAGERFAFTDGIHTFAGQPYIASRFRLDVDREIDLEDRQAIERYAAAVWLVHHHRASLDDVAELREEHPGAAIGFVRSAAWAFLTVWTQRYGGLNARLVVRGTLVDPSLDDPKG